MIQLADKIPVAVFRQIFHWPLIPAPDCPRDISFGEWNNSSAVDPLDLLGTDETAKRNAVQEFNYFHDFIQRFLYECEDEKRAFTLYERSDLEGLDVHLKDAVHHFSVERLTLHRFETGDRPVIVTLETLWQKRDGSDSPLTLAEAQTLIDVTRRSYVPFWDNGNLPGRCPWQVTLHWKGREPEPHPIDIQPSQIFDDIKKCRNDDAPILSHWRSIAGLNLNGDAEGCHWRDPSDERIPAMSLILLASNGLADNRSTLRQIGDPDWLRLIDAEKAGSGWPYNPDFAAGMIRDACYDRFLPDDGMPEYFATRHLFGGAHYACVSCADGFGIDVLQQQFRRHYAQMGMMIRFEYASLLAFSSRLTRAVTDLHERKASQADAKFINEVSRIRADFLQFVNRFRFTGVSSQDQGRDMFARWRKSLGLDALFADVSTEMETTAAYVSAERERERNDRAESLSRFAHYAAAIALVIGVIATPIWERLIKSIAQCDTKCTSLKLIVVEGLLVIMLLGISQHIARRLLRRSRRQSRKP